MFKARTCALQASRKAGEAMPGARCAEAASGSATRMIVSNATKQQKPRVVFSSMVTSL
jgi:hypothetical protein